MSTFVCFAIVNDDLWLTGIWMTWRAILTNWLLMTCWRRTHRLLRRLKMSLNLAISTLTSRLLSSCAVDASTLPYLTASTCLCLVGLDRWLCCDLSWNKLVLNSTCNFQASVLPLHQGVSYFVWGSECGCQTLSSVCQLISGFCQVRCNACALHLPICSPYHICILSI